MKYTWKTKFYFNIAVPEVIYSVTEFKREWAGVAYKWQCWAGYSLSALDPHSGIIQQSLTYHGLYALFTQCTRKEYIQQWTCSFVCLSIHMTQPESQWMNCDETLNLGYINNKVGCVITDHSKFTVLTFYNQQ
jgi:hypothetical protein